MASEYLKWKYRDVKPDEPVVLTPEQKRKNWWHYHKWHVLIGTVLVLAAANILYHVLGFGEVRPDYQIAYIGAAPLPGDTAEALETALSAFGRDCNGDGRVTVRLNQYVSGGQSKDDDRVYYAAASAKLMADLTDCDSYFFLMDDPKSFQRNYEILRRLDGSLSDGTEDAVSDCSLSWTDCPVLASLELGTYSEVILGQQAEGDSHKLLSGLYVARRGFWNEKKCDHEEDCDALWEALTEGAKGVLP